MNYKGVHMEKELKNKLGNIIKKTRKYKKISQNDLSRRMNYSQSFISKLEKGEHNILLSNYETALKTLGLHYNFSKDIKNKSKRIIEDLHEAFSHFDFLKINELHHQFEELMPNILYYYDYLICELVSTFTNIEFDECHKLINQIKPHIESCNETSQTLYQEIIELLNLFDKRNDKQVNDFYLGLMYFHQFNHSLALKYFIKAKENFKNETNEDGFIRCEIFINNILMKENDMLDIKIRCEKLLHDTSKIIPSDLATLQFQLAYSLYYQNNYKEALQILKLIKNKPLFFEEFIDYYKQKCLFKLKQDMNKKHTYLEKLFIHHQMEDKNDAYYSLIEENIIPHLKTHSYIKEYQVYSMDLMNHYFEKRAYKKYKKLTEQLAIVYKIDSCLSLVR